MKVVFNFLALVALLLSYAKAHKSCSSEEKPEYECAIKFSRYYLDNEPAEYGVFGGYYAPGKKAYIGIGNYEYAAFTSGRLQLDPPGMMLTNSGGNGKFINDSRQIWYLRRRSHQNLEWIKSKNAEAVPFAIEYNKEVNGFPSYIGRIKKNNISYFGIVAPFFGKFFYIDVNGVVGTATEGYQVLTCKTKRKEKKIPLPKLPAPPTPTATSTGSAGSACIDSWLPYNNDDEPSKKGVSAGSHDCGNTAYVGKGESFGLFGPGRIQTIPESGLYYGKGGEEALLANGSYYLADNPNYTYYWVPSGDTSPSNIVLVTQKVGKYSFGIARVKINGHMQIGSYIPPVASFPGTSQQNYYDFEILVCDPLPKYQCGQQWKKLNSNDSSLATDGFSIDGSIFIGRGTRKCVNGCDFGLGRVQADSKSVAYLDDLTATAVVDNSSTVEYLVKNKNNTYKWVASRDGVKVANALEIQNEGHRPFYIGYTRINDNVVVGKVRPGEGLYFIDPVSENLQTISSYEVLTCTSPDASNGQYQEQKDDAWFGSFGCPARKEWSFTKWSCVCREEFKGIFVFSGAKWDESTCSYIDA